MLLISRATDSLQTLKVEGLCQSSVPSRILRCVLIVMLPRHAKLRVPRRMILDLSYLVFFLEHVANSVATIRHDRMRKNILTQPRVQCCY